MKISTRVLAWIYISLHLLLLGFMCVIGLWIEGSHPDVRAILAEHLPRFAPVCDVPTPLASGICIVGVTLLFLSLFVWFSLLKKKAWAWWAIVFTFTVLSLDTSTAVMRRGVEGVLNAGSAALHGHPGKIMLLAVYLLSIGVLAIDSPSRWRGQSPRKRRKSRVSTNRRKVSRRKRRSS